MQTSLLEDFVCRPKSRNSPWIRLWQRSGSLTSEAYRPSSIRLADEVVYVDDKRILGHGSHQELLETVPGYARMLKAYEEEALRLRREASCPLTPALAPSSVGLSKRRRYSKKDFVSRCSWRWRVRR